MEKIFRKRKAICPRCKSWEYSRFRCLNNKKRSKKLQPRYICRKCNKYFTLGGKLYNTSLHSRSKARILPDRCPGKVLPPCYSFNDGAYSWNGFPEAEDSVRTVMTGARTFHKAAFERGEAYCGSMAALNLPYESLYGHGTHFSGYGRHSCCCSFVNPYSNAASYGNFGMWLQNQDRWQIYDSFENHSGAEFVPFISLPNSYEDLEGNAGINQCLNTNPLWNIDPMEPLEVSKERELEIGLLLSESVGEKARGNVPVTEQEREVDENAESSNSNLYGGEGMDLSSEECEWLMNILVPGKEENNSAIGGDSICFSQLEDFDAGFGLKLYDLDFQEMSNDSGRFDTHVDFFGDCKVDDVANLWRFVDKEENNSAIGGDSICFSQLQDFDAGFGLELYDLDF